MTRNRMVHEENKKQLSLEDKKQEDIIGENRKLKTIGEEIGRCMEKINKNLRLRDKKQEDTGRKKET